MDGGRYRCRWKCDKTKAMAKEAQVYSDCSCDEMILDGELSLADPLVSRRVWFTKTKDDLLELC